MYVPLKANQSRKVELTRSFIWLQSLSEKEIDIGGEENSYKSKTKFH